MGRYLRVEAQNLYATLYDTDQLSIVRGSSRLLADAIREIPKLAKAELQPLRSGGESALFKLLVEGDDPTSRLAKELRDHYPDFCFSVGLVDVADESEALPASSALVRWQQSRQPRFAVADAVLPGTDVCSETRVRATSKTCDGDRMSVSARRRFEFGRQQRQSFWGGDAVENLKQLTTGSPFANIDGQACALGFTLDRPYCFGARAIEGNRFESVPYVPGGALRGALFAACEQLARDDHYKPDAERLVANAGRIHFRHAWASTVERNPAVIPESALKLADVYVDASSADLERPFLWRAQSDEWRVPDFRIDWKSSTFLEQRGCILPERSIEVRTAINAETGAAQDDTLFSLECCVPGEDKLSYRYQTHIVLDAGEPLRRDLWRALARLLPLALWRLGKTDAQAHDLGWRAWTPPVSEPTSCDRVVVMLQSDALLEPADGSMPQANASILPWYRKYFEPLDCGMTLIDVFADQSLVGGRYFKLRFWGTPYRPRALTRAGTVFVFRVTDSTMANRLSMRSWRRPLRHMPATSKRSAPMRRRLGGIHRSC